VHGDSSRTERAKMAGGLEALYVKELRMWPENLCGQRTFEHLEREWLNICGQRTYAVVERCGQRTMAATESVLRDVAVGSLAA
jgi:hypothetical protein